MIFVLRYGLYVGIFRPMRKEAKGEVGKIANAGFMICAARRAL
jgi:hypothetical protein